jgi:RNA polymerase sigma-70 factor (ECF subfamily)
MSFTDDVAGGEHDRGVDRDLTLAATTAQAEAELNELALRASSGDQQALGELLDRIRGPVVWQCRARMNGRTIGQQTPEDIAQEVLIAVCGALGRFRPTETRWKAFVYGIVRNKVIDAYRAAGRDRSEPMEELPDHVDDDDRAGPEAAVLRSDDRALLHELLAELPDLQREVLVLRVAVGYSAEETAQLIGSTSGAVRVTQVRAMVKLRALLAKRIAGTLDDDAVPEAAQAATGRSGPMLAVNTLEDMHAAYVKALALDLDVSTGLADIEQCYLHRRYVADLGSHLNLDAGIAALANRVEESK